MSDGVKITAMIDRYKALKKNVVERYGKIEAPKDKTRFPGNLSSLSDDEIVNWLAHYTEWQGYAGGQAGEADADRKVAESLYKNEKSRALARLAGDKKVRKFELDADIDNDPEIQKLKERWQYHEAAYSLENSYKDGFEKYCFVLSRELTRRLKGEEARFRKDKFGDQEDSKGYDLLKNEA